MTGFYRSDSEITCDGVSISALAESEATPFYVYSGAHIRERYEALDRAFAGYPHRIHYALKANSTLAIATLLRQFGAAADANSIWELEVARRAGFSARDLVLTGVGKSLPELECAVPLDLKAINIESVGELERLEKIATRLGLPVRVAIRINPDIDARSHPHISTGLRINKFGVPADVARELALSVAVRPAVTLVALHVHVGSQITALDPLSRTAAFMAETVSALQELGVTLEYVDMGGGLGISYDGEIPISPHDYVATLVDHLASTGLPIVIEPGRSIVGSAGALVARVIDMKPRTASSTFAVIDAGMTELMRPALYDAYHRIEVVRPRPGDLLHYEIAGPVCESSDIVGRDRLLPPLQVGDLVAVLDAGAYGSAMASNYNRRPLPAELLVEPDGWRVIRRRQTVDDMLALEA